MLGPASRFAVALSGGLDSTVLLALMARIALPGQLRALHVDHGLHADSAHWAAFCARVAESLGVPLMAGRVEIEAVPGQSIEALAREARYEALANMLGDGEVLLTAHQADDQLETVLFRLMRGAGVRGMRGIIDFDAFGPGYLARPLLGLTRESLAEVAEEWGLGWIEDPSNSDMRFDRNFLRARVLPGLKDHWPGAALAAVRLGQAMGDAEDNLAALARLDSRAIDDPGRISCAELRALGPARLRNLLRHLTDKLGLPAPDSRQLAELVKQLGAARRDAGTRVNWPGAEARIYRDHLYLLAPLPRPVAGSGHRPLTSRGPASGAFGRLELTPCTGTGLPDAWVRQGLELEFRRGGELFKPLGRSHARPLKKWLQEAAIVPWMRDRIPLLLHDGTIVAVGDLWLGDAVCAARAGRSWRVSWTEHPRLH